MSARDATDDVARLESPDRGAFLDLLARGRPAIISGLMEDWPALTRWSVEYFAEKLGPDPVPVGILPKSEDIRDMPDSFPWLHMSSKRFTMAEFVERLASPECHRYYITAMSLNKNLPDLMEDLTPPEVLEDVASGPVSPRLWFGKQVLGPLHYDTINNLHGIVVGSKRFIFAGPDQTRHVYARRAFEGLPHMSRASLREMDEQRFPRLRRVKAQDFTAEAGEIVFIPRGWWHEVITPDTTISVDFPWAGPRSLDWMFLRLLPSQLNSRIRRGRRSRRPAITERA